MKELIELKKHIQKYLFKFEEYVLTDGTTIIYDGELKEGTEVFTYDEKGEKVILPDGQITIEGKVYEVKEGKVVSITDETKPEEKPEPEVKLENEVKLEEFNKLKEEVFKMTEATSSLIKIVEKLSIDLQKFEEQPISDKIDKVIVKEDIKTKYSFLKK